MFIFSFIWKIIKSIFKLGFWILKGFLSPIGCIIRIIIIAAIVAGFIFVFA